MSKKNSTADQNSKSHLAAECDKVGEIAVGYGFTVVVPPRIAPDDFSKAKQFRDFDFYGDAEEKVALLRWFDENNFFSEPPPLLIHFKKPLHGSERQKKPSEESYGFEIMGSARATSEALLIKTALSVLSDLGYKDLCLDINSIGDKESIGKFDRELASYFRKRSGELPAKMRAEFKKNPYAAIASAGPAEEIFDKDLPQTVATLSDLSREHFREVLEYLEAFECVYKIRRNLLPNKSYASGTIFEIRQMTEKNNGPLLAYGYRYNYLAKKIGLKKDIPSVGMTLVVKKTPAVSKKIIVKKIKKPCLYLIQLGGTAKLKALNVVETLRKNKIPVCHSVIKDKIGGQLSGADYIHASHLLIIGQKEALENTVVVRHAVTREQETVPMKDLPEFLKKLK
jgi:histidyl-tRNA synthetase